MSAAVHVCLLSDLSRATGSNHADSHCSTSHSAACIIEGDHGRHAEPDVADKDRTMRPGVSESNHDLLQPVMREALL